VNSLVTDLAQDVIIPVVAAYAAIVWKRLGKNDADWNPDDRLLISEFLVAAVFLQLTFLSGDTWLVLTGHSLNDSQVRALLARSGMLFMITFLVSPAAVLSLRDYTRNRPLTNEIADRLSSAATGFLALIFVFNQFINSAFTS
jgi:hypothetical protein